MSDVFHPVQYVESFLRHYPEVKTVELSVYRYKPQSLLDDRIIHRIEPNQLDSAFAALRNECRDCEIAFHSCVITDTEKQHSVMHMPLIDFRSTSILEIKQCASELVRELGCTSAAVFNSGRSFHLYLGTLLAPDAWTKFMGRVLLFNMPDSPEVVDSRWIGHRLIAGYGALRWTRNTEHYLSEPAAGTYIDSGI